LHGRISERSKPIHPRPIPAAIPTFSSATSTLEDWAFKHWPISHRAASPRMPPRATPNYRTRIAAPGRRSMAIRPGQAPSVTGTPHDLLLPFRGATERFDCAAASATGLCYLDMLPPQSSRARALLAFTLDSLGVQSGQSMPRPCLARLKTRPRCGPRRRGTQGLSRTLPLHLRC